MNARSDALTGWRRVACAMWPSPRDPQIFGQLDIDAGPLLRCKEAARREGRHLTPTHFVVRALATALEAVPELNVRIVGGRSIPRDSIELFVITALSRGHDDLTGFKLNAASLTLLEVADAMDRKASQLRSGTRDEFARSKRLMEALPLPLLRVALRLSALAAERLQLDMPSLGITRTPFGSAMISSVGSLGLSHGFAPLAWMYDVPLLLLVGEIVERAVVIEGRVVARPILPLSATIDHRYVDGVHLSRLVRTVREYLEHPDSYEPPWTARALA